MHLGLDFGTKVGGGSIDWEWCTEIDCIESR